ncbi:hypothetical protein [Streptomyces sp. GbtcB6]|uniref:hypothetical protein n=1 Tax=Streptomyces sp. GbtcB6 TaxID=2824751 RepID=UPI001C30C8D2|nr:hypothetical protein [Streptomyces sp. GbtcB6]
MATSVTAPRHSGPLVAWMPSTKGPNPSTNRLTWTLTQQRAGCRHLLRHFGGGRESAGAGTRQFTVSGYEYGIDPQHSGNREFDVDATGRIGRRHGHLEVVSDGGVLVRKNSWTGAAGELELFRRADEAIRSGAGHTYFFAGQQKLGDDPVVRRGTARDVDLGEPFQTVSGDPWIGREGGQWNPQHAGPGKHVAQGAAGRQPTVVERYRDGLPRRRLTAARHAVERRRRRPVRRQPVRETRLAGQEETVLTCEVHIQVGM